jgi:hypothetical protein
MAHIVVNPTTIQLLQWRSYYCTVIFYVVIPFLFMILCGLFEWKQLCPYLYRLFISVFPLGIQISSGEGYGPFSRFNPATCCVPVPNMYFHHRMTWFLFMFIEVVIHFADNGGIVDHHCLYFLFKINLIIMLPWLLFCAMLPWTNTNRLLNVHLYTYLHMALGF